MRDQGVGIVETISGYKIGDTRRDCQSPSLAGALPGDAGKTHRRAAHLTPMGGGRHWPGTVGNRFRGISTATYIRHSPPSSPRFLDDVDDKLPRAAGLQGSVPEHRDILFLKGVDIGIRPIRRACVLDQARSASIQVPTKVDSRYTSASSPTRRSNIHSRRAPRAIGGRKQQIRGEKQRFNFDRRRTAGGRRSPPRSFRALKTPI